MTKFVQKPQDVEAWKVEDLLLAAEGWTDVPPLIQMYYQDGNILFNPDSLQIRVRDAERGEFFEAPKNYWIVYNHGFFEAVTQQYLDEQFEPGVGVGPVDEGFVGIEKELSSLLNKYSAESVSGTPDFILAKFMLESVKAYNEAVSHRAEWRGETCKLPALQK